MHRVPWKNVRVVYQSAGTQVQLIAALPSKTQTARPRRAVTLLTNLVQHPRRRLGDSHKVCKVFSFLGTKELKSMRGENLNESGVSGE